MGKWCFVISVIGDKGSEERRYADDLFDYIIRPAAERAGYSDVKRADHIHDSGILTVQVIEAIVSADMVVADLTRWNPNVYYELAVRHFTGLPIVQMVSHDAKLPFDVQQVRTVHFGLGVREAQEAVEDLCNKLLAAGSEEYQINPITEATAAKSFKSKGTAESNHLAILIESQSAIAAAVQKIQSDVTDMKRADEARRALPLQTGLAGLGGLFGGDTGALPRQGFLSPFLPEGPRVLPKEPESECGPHGLFVVNESKEKNTKP